MTRSEITDGRNWAAMALMAACTLHWQVFFAIVFFAIGEGQAEEMFD
ncbi:MAG: hypothetical protein ACR2G5_11270 [Pyrinomonadaceae bacterium]